MNRCISQLCLWSLLLGASTVYAAEATPSDVYAQAVRIEQEVDALKLHFGITADAHSEAKSGDLHPRHIWAKSYVILLKLGKLRRKLGLTYVEPVGIEPMLDMPLNQTWDMTQRILSEIAILEHHLDIPGQAPAAVRVTGKRPVDGYNRLHHISADLELLAGKVTPSEIYGQVKRINEDINAILRHQRLFERAVPPVRKESLQPKDSLQAVFALTAQIQRIQRGQGLPAMDYAGFESGDKTTPDDIYGMVAHALMELQRVKAQLGMTHSVTPGATFEENKTPADVVQLLGYAAEKLKFIKAR